MAQFDITKISRNLQLSGHYMSYFLVGMKKFYTDKIKTACVGFTNNSTLFMAYNEEFMNSHTKEEQEYIVKHEMLHLLLGHLYMEDFFKDREVANIAQDLVINQMLTKKNAPSSALFPDDPQINLPPDLSSFEYYNLLMKSKNQQLKDMLEKIKNGTCQPGEKGYDIEIVPRDVDPDQKGSPMEQENQQLMNEISNRILQEKLQQIADEYEKSGKNRGDIPGEYTRKIELEGKPKMPWKSALKRFITASLEVTTTRNRRFESKKGHPEKTNPAFKSKKNIYIGVDTSGSMGAKEISAVFVEINSLIRSVDDVCVTVIECDARIGRIYPYNGKFDGKVTGGGGKSVCLLL
jgi:predicted metal-dependent peptidase